MHHHGSVRTHAVLYITIALTMPHACIYRSCTSTIPASTIPHRVYQSSCAYSPHSTRPTQTRCPVRMCCVQPLVLHAIHRLACIFLRFTSLHFSHAPSSWPRVRPPVCVLQPCVHCLSILLQCPTYTTSPPRLFSSLLPLQLHSFSAVHHLAPLHALPALRVPLPYLTLPA